MEQEKNDMLLNDLFEAKGSFDNLIEEMKDKNITFPYDDTIKLEETSYSKAFNAISRMNNYTEEYNYLIDANEDFYEKEAYIIVRGILLYGVTIVALKLFSKTLSSKQISDMWYMLIGVLLGSINTGIIYNNINNYRYGDKDNREFVNRISLLKESYKEDYHIAMNEIDCLFSLNRNLWKELDNEKEKQFIKKK